VGARWLALAGWLLDKGRDDEAVAVRVYWPAFRDHLAHATLAATPNNLAEHARLFGSIARQIEADFRPADWQRRRPRANPRGPRIIKRNKAGREFDPARLALVGPVLED
jgi:hypothetical protein